MSRLRRGWVAAALVVLLVAGVATLFLLRWLQAHVKLNSRPL